MAATKKPTNHYLALRIANHLNRKTDRGRQVIGLSGHWGSGKTHLWENNIKPKLTGKWVIRQPLFGTNSIASLSHQILLRSGAVVAPTKIEKRLTSRAGHIAAEITKGALNYGKSLLEKYGVPAPDLTALIPSGLIICLDDLERISPNMPIEELFAFIDYLATENDCTILVIFNEDELPKSVEDRFLTFKEKLFTRLYKIQPELDTVFESLVQQLYKGSPNAKRVRACKEAICSMIPKNQVNYRNLERIIRSHGELFGYKEFSLTPSARDFLSATILEQGAGKLREKEFYDFPAWQLTDKQNKEAAAYRSQFINQFFSQEGRRYTFSNAVYQYVTEGLVDSELFIEEFGQTSTATPEKQLLLQLQREATVVLSDLEIISFKERTESILGSSNELNSREVFELFQNLEKMLLYTNEKPAERIVGRVKDSLRQLAVKGDPTIGSFSFYDQTDLPISKELIKMAMELKEDHVKSQTKNALRTAFSEGDLGTISETATLKKYGPEAVEELLNEDETWALWHVKPNLIFFLLKAAIESSAGKSDQHSGKIREILIDRLTKEKNSKSFMERYRANELLGYLSKQNPSSSKSNESLAK